MPEGGALIWLQTAQAAAALLALDHPLRGIRFKRAESLEEGAELLSPALGLLAVVAVEVGLAARSPALTLEGQGEPGERRGAALGVELGDERSEGLLQSISGVGLGVGGQVSL